MSDRADARLSQLYKPYHSALAALMEETRARFGVAVLIDWHSMPSALSVPDVRSGRCASEPAVQTLSQRPGGADGRDPRPLRRGGADRLPFHALSAVGARCQIGPMRV